MWEPGRYCGYHAVTFGYLVGEVIRRVSGSTVGQFLADNVTSRLGVDFYIGLPAAHDDLVRPSTVPPEAQADPLDLPSVFAAHRIDATSPLARAMLAPDEDGPGGAVWNTRPYRAAEVPAVNGHGNGRALARMYAACIGEVDGIRLLSPETVERARTPMTDDIPTAPEFAAITTMPPRFGLGFQLPRAQIDAMLGPGSFGHTGAGGRLGFAHPELGVAFGFTCDAMMWDGLTQPDPRWTPLLAAIASAL
jgi:CubicO group peptidase (beta-lactamase class C family)